MWFFFCMISSVTAQPCYRVCFLQLLPRLITLEFQVIALEFLIKQILQPAGTPPFQELQLSRVTSSSRWAWARGPLTLNSWSETTLTHKIAFLGISMHCFQKKTYYQHVRNAVLDVCAKSVPVCGKSGEMRGLLQGVTLSWHVLCLEMYEVIERIP